MNPVLELSANDWLSLFNHFASLSLLAVGGAITVAPDMHRFLVEEKIWLSESQFTSSIALAQAAPGPNILFVALMGFNVGMNAGASLGGGWMSVGLASLGLVLTLMGIMLPSSVLTYTATRWAHQHRDKLGIRAFKSGMAPIVIALLLSTSWLLTLSHNRLHSTCISDVIDESAHPVKLQVRQRASLSPDVVFFVLVSHFCPMRL